MTAEQLAMTLYLLHEMVEYQRSRRHKRNIPPSVPYIKWRVAVRWIAYRSKMPPATVIEALKSLIDFECVKASHDRKKIRPIKLTVEI